MIISKKIKIYYLMAKELCVIKLVLLGDEKTGKTKFAEYITIDYGSINFDSYEEVFTL